MLFSTNKSELNGHLNPFMTYLVSNQQASTVDNTSDLYTHYLNGIYQQQQQQQQQIFVQQRFLTDFEQATLEGNYGKIFFSL
jgi:hypothetical protein